MAVLVLLMIFMLPNVPLSAALLFDPSRRHPSVIIWLLLSDVVGIGALVSVIRLTKTSCPTQIGIRPTLRMSLLIAPLTLFGSAIALSMIVERVLHFSDLRGDGLIGGIALLFALFALPRAVMDLYQKPKRFGDLAWATLWNALLAGAIIGGSYALIRSRIGLRWLSY